MNYRVKLFFGFLFVVVGIPVLVTFFLFIYLSDNTAADGTLSSWFMPKSELLMEVPKPGLYGDVLITYWGDPGPQYYISYSVYQNIDDTADVLYTYFLSKGFLLSESETTTGTSYVKGEPVILDEDNEYDFSFSATKGAVGVKMRVFSPGQVNVNIDTFVDW